MPLDLRIRKPRIPGVVPEQTDAPEIPSNDYSIALGETPQTGNPNNVFESVPRQQPTSNPMMERDVSALEREYQNPPQFQRKPVSVGQNILSSLFGRFDPIENHNGERDYREALGNYQARTQGLQGAVGLERQGVTDQFAQDARTRQTSIDDLNRRNVESQISTRANADDLQRQRDEAADARQAANLTSLEKRSSDSLAASEARQTASQNASDQRQERQIAASDARTNKIIAGQEDRAQKPKPLSSKDRLTVKGKLTNLKIAKQQLKQIREKFVGIKGSMSAGPGWSGQGIFATESGNAFDQAVAPLRQTVIGLTRTPGIGAMSDYETRLAQAPMPSRMEYESVTEQSIQQLEDYINTLDEEYSSMDSDDSGAGDSRTGSTKFTDGGKTYNIPNEHVQEFKRDHPHAR